MVDCLAGMKAALKANRMEGHLAVLLVLKLVEESVCRQLDNAKANIEVVLRVEKKV